MPPVFCFIRKRKLQIGSDIQIWNAKPNRSPFSSLALIGQAVFSAVIQLDPFHHIFDAVTAGRAASQ